MFSGVLANNIYLANVYLHRGDYENAINYWEKVEKIFKIQFDKRIIDGDEATINGMLYSKLSIGNVYLNKEDYNNAIKQYLLFS